MKTKIKKWVIYVGIGLMLLSWMVDLQRQAFRDLVELEYQWLYGDLEQVQINIPDAVTVETLIRRTFKQDSKVALAVFRAESGLRCNAVSHTGDIGPAQINAKWHSKRGNLFDCQDNIRVAKEIFDEQGGFQAWVAYKSGAYKKFLASK